MPVSIINTVGQRGSHTGRVFTEVEREHHGAINQFEGYEVVAVVVSSVVEQQAVGVTCGEADLDNHDMSLFEGGEGEEGALSEATGTQFTGGGVVEGAGAVGAGEAPGLYGRGGYAGGHSARYAGQHGTCGALDRSAVTAVSAYAFYTWSAQHVHLAVHSCKIKIKKLEMKDNTKKL